jgi:HTH-type transcriptional regulator/antitoxin HigA
VLAALIEAYEARVWRIEAPDPVSAILEVMETRSLTQADLAKLIGSRSRASEILEGPTKMAALFLRSSGFGPGAK